MNQYILVYVGMQDVVVRLTLDMGETEGGIVARVDGTRTLCHDCDRVLPCV